MLTPSFELSQDDCFLIVKIKAPLAKVSETEILIEAKEILFYSKPYYLRLYFPSELIENGSEKADYDSEEGYFTIFAPKKVSGEHFDNLNFLSCFLAPCGTENAATFAEEVLEDGNSVDNQDNETANKADLRWFWEQKIPESESVLNISERSRENNDSFCYGFASKREGVFKQLKEEISGLLELCNADVLSVNERKKESFKLEMEKFDEEYYLADYFAPEDLDKYLCVETPWFSAGTSNLQLSADEICRLKDFPRRTYKDLSEKQTQSALLSLIDIAFAYAYDFRITEGEHCVESGWTLSRLSPTLSCLLSWENPREVVEACFRRSVSYPLCRNWSLAEKVFYDVLKIFARGKVCLLKCLLDVHKMFSTSGEYRYILNELYITDYCLWIQQTDEKIIQSFAAMLSEIEICKEDTGIDLTELELVAQIESLKGSSINYVTPVVKLKLFVSGWGYARDYVCLKHTFKLSHNLWMTPKMSGEGRGCRKICEEVDVLAEIKKNVEDGRAAFFDSDDND